MSADHSGASLLRTVTIRGPAVCLLWWILPRLFDFKWDGFSAQSKDLNKPIQRGKFLLSLKDLWISSWPLWAVHTSTTIIITCPPLSYVSFKLFSLCSHSHVWEVTNETPSGHDLCSSGKPLQHCKPRVSPECKTCCSEHGYQSYY